MIERYTAKIREAIHAIVPSVSKWRYRRVGIAMVRDEADIIEAFVRHNLQLLNHLIILDDGSMDGTWEILTLLASEKKRQLTIRREMRLGQYQAGNMSRLLKEAAHEFSADWIFPLDADEFLSLPEKANPLTDPRDLQLYYKIPWITYATSPSDDPSCLNPVERLRHRMAQEFFQGDASYKAVIPGPLARNEGARLSRGNHLFYIGENEPPSRLLENCGLAHFSIRSLWQGAWKLCQRQLQVQCDPDYLAKRRDFEWLPYQRIRESYSLFEEDFKRAFPPSVHLTWPWTGQETVPEPFACLGGPLRYTKLEPERDYFFRRFLSYTEKMADVVRNSAPRANPSPIPATWNIHYFNEQNERCSDLLPAEMTPGVPCVLTWVCETVNWNRPVHMVIQPGQTMFEIQTLRAHGKDDAIVQGLPCPSEVFRMVSGALEVADRNFHIFFTGEKGGRLEWCAENPSTFTRLKALSMVIIASQDPARLTGCLAGETNVRGTAAIQALTRPWWRLLPDGNPALKQRLLIDPSLLWRVKATMEAAAAFPRMLCPAMPGELMSHGPFLYVPDGTYRVTLHYRSQGTAGETFAFAMHAGKGTRPLFRGTAPLNKKSREFTLDISGVPDLEICFFGAGVPYEVEFIEMQRIDSTALPSPYDCPVCERSVGEFMPLKERLPGLAGIWEKHGFDMQLFAQAETLNLHQYACPHCLANDRSRLCALFLRSHATGASPAEKRRLLDIAPSKPLQKMILELGCFEYRSADLQMADADDRIDITNMSLYDGDSFDCFICSHVLEHVADDRAAIAELFRILKPGGWGIVMVPIPLSLATTVEDTGLADPAERIRRFGQDDHLRMYAKHDFVQRLREARFEVDQLGMTHFGADVFHKHGITQSSVLYVCRKK